jgi:hypothetical protein
LKLGNVTNPISGKEDNILSANTWIQNILGVCFFLIILNIGQKIANVVSGKSGGMVRAGLDTPITGSPTPDTNKREVY